jgi:hypothetical protein
MTTTLKKDALQLLETDTLFKDSPDAGSKACICSRCGAMIQQHEMAIRCWTTNKKGKVDKNSQEYRYCELCMTGKKFFNCRMYMEYYHKCEAQCQDCKNDPYQFNF